MVGLRISLRSRASAPTNALGVVVGTIGGSFESRAFIWDEAGGYRLLPAENEVRPLGWS